MAMWLAIDFSYVHSLHVWEGKVQKLKLKKDIRAVGSE